MLSMLRDGVRRLWRLSALRQALVLTAAFLVVVTGAAIFAIFEVRDAMDRRVDDRLEARFLSTRLAIANGDFAEEPSFGTSLERVIFIPQSRSDAEGYGESGTFFDDDLVPAQGLFRGRPKEPWIFYGGAVDGGWLIVGQNVGEVSVFDEVLADTFIGIGWAAVGLSLCLGLLSGWRTQRRLSEVTHALDRAAEGDLSARVAPHRDRDDLDQLGFQVDDTIARIGTALEQARGFSANIAHDLKTPLTRLRMRLESALLAEGNREDEVGAALEEADRAIAIFDAFLRLSKLESGALEKNFAPVDLKALCTDLAQTYAAVVEDTGRQLRTDLSEVSMMGDKVLLGQFLSNLIQNGIRHTPKGSTLTLIVKPGVLGVLDDGPGIPHAELENVLAPLYRLDHSRTTDGAGLGLSLANAIATHHGAVFRLSAPDDRGAGLFARMVWPSRSNKGANLTKM